MTSTETTSYHGAFREEGSRQWRCGEQGNTLVGSDVPEDLQGDVSDLRHDGASYGTQAEPQALGVEDDQQHGHGGAHLHPGVCQPTDQEDGARDGQPGQGDLLTGNGYTARPEEDRGGGRTSLNNPDKLVKGDTDAKDTFGITFGDEHHHHPRTYRGEDRRCSRTGTDLRRDSDMLLWHGGQVASEPEGKGGTSRRRSSDAHDRWEGNADTSSGPRTSPTTTRQTSSTSKGNRWTGPMRTLCAVWCKNSALIGSQRERAPTAMSIARAV